jgi:hypothetical protein
VQTAFANAVVSNQIYVYDGPDNFIDFRGWPNEEKYNFELRYTSSSDTATLRWTQIENPLSTRYQAPTVSNIYATWNEQDTVLHNFHGLSVGSS